MNWRRGLNFSRSRYKILGNDTFSTKDEEINKFRKLSYKFLFKDLILFNKKLIEFDLSTESHLKEIKNEYILQ